MVRSGGLGLLGEATQVGAQHPHRGIGRPGGGRSPPATTPGITYLSVTGVSPSRVGVVWPRANDTDPVVRDFVLYCLDNVI
ncbi:MAG TPA: hypothetical protein VFW65_38585 [Pseudonocardiaceae bacterium]|nr:hypothetical protein [Pseudonocardiaceae bacterium]